MSVVHIRDSTSGNFHIRTVGPSTDRRNVCVGVSGSVAHEIITKCGTMEVDYGPSFHRRTVLHVRGSHQRLNFWELSYTDRRMDVLEVHVQSQLQAIGSVSTDEFKKQLVEMRAQVAKLAKMPGELLTSKPNKRKHKAEESDEELSTDLSKEERRQHKKSDKASRKKAREDEALAQQQRDAVLAGASGSRVPVLVSGSQSEPELVYESAPVDKGPDADPATGT
uniref:Integrase core domain containing protein n=1 Tax=Solanum tuberosum TaxID=4113 RepID=M1E0J6_SOLTU